MTPGPKHYNEIVYVGYLTYPNIGYPGVGFDKPKYNIGP